MYDTIIIGARVAGSPTAMLLARMGHRVLLLDRATFPSDTMSTHALAGDAIKRLKNWGVIDRVLATGAAQLQRVEMSAEGHTEVFEFPLTMNPRRFALDAVLLEAAREAGAEVRLGVTVRELLTDASGRVSGVLIQRPDGSLIEEQAAIVVGADGRNSRVAKAVDAPRCHVLPGLTSIFYTYAAGFESDATEISSLPRKSGFIFPTNDGLAVVGAEWRVEDYARFKADPMAGIRETFEAIPGWGERLRDASIVADPIGMKVPDNYYRKPWGRGWALVGDAGYWKDPALAQGINDAFRDAELLANAIDAGLRRRQLLGEALAAYEQERNERSFPMYQVNYEASKLQTTKATLQAMGARQRQRSASQAA